MNIDKLTLLQNIEDNTDWFNSRELEIFKSIVKDVKLNEGITSNKVINDRLNLGQAMDIKKIAEIINSNNNKKDSDFLKLVNSVYDINDLELKNTKKSKYHLTKLIYHITCYALENDKFLKVFNIDKKSN